MNDREQWPRCPPAVFQNLPGPSHPYIPIQPISLNEVSKGGITFSKREVGVLGFPSGHFGSRDAPLLSARSIHLRIPDSMHRGLSWQLCVHEYRRSAFFGPGNYWIISALPISSVWNHTMGPDELRERAYRYRKMADGISDARAVKALNDLAAEYEARADETPLNNEVGNDPKDRGPSSTGQE